MRIAGGRPTPLRGLRPGKLDRRALAANIEWLRRHRATPETAEAIQSLTSRDTSVPAAELGRYIERYEAREQRKGLLNFEDMMGLCIALLE